MSIFKETLPKFIIDQLTIREAIVKQGNNIKGDKISPRTGSPRVELKDNKGNSKKITIDPGAFFTNAVSKQCVIRMSSGAEILPGTFPDWLTEPTGVELSKRWVLEGGMPKEDTTKIKIGTKKTTNEKGEEIEEDVLGTVRTPRGGFARGKGSVYGDERIRSDAKDGYGIVPMPGIIDLNVRTKTAYGSLRDAKINFICHNRNQLEILELLYMRPGYPVLVEWGWLPYIGNDGRRETYFPTLSEWWDSNSTLDKINELILLRKKQSGGNYDAFAGIVKNFEINARPDGGFNCSTELISMGEVLEGLKGDTGEDELLYRKDQSLDKTAPIHTFLSYLWFLKCVSEQGVEGSEPLSEPMLKLGKQIVQDIINPYSGVVRHDQVEDGSEGDQEITPDLLFGKSYAPGYGSNAEAVALGMSDEDFYEAIVNKNESLSDEEKEAELERLSAMEDLTAFTPFIISPTENLLPNAVLGEVTAKYPMFGNLEMDSGFAGVSWDLLCEIFNTYVAPQIKPPSQAAKKIIVDNESGEDVNTKFFEPETLSSFTFYEKNTNKYLNYSKVSFPANFKLNFQTTTAVDGDVVTETTTVDSSKLLGGSLDKGICLLPHQFTRQIVEGGRTLSNQAYGWTLIGNEDIEAVTSSPAIGTLGVSKAIMTDRSIGKIFMNIDYLLKTFHSMYYDEEGFVKEFNFLGFFQKVWEQDITDATGKQHNFRINVDPHRNTRYRVIDHDVQTLDIQTPAFKDKPAQFQGVRAEDVYKFKIQSNESVMRDFNFNTSIPADMSSIISIAAQAPDSISSLSQVSFAAFNKNIRSRFTHTPTGLTSDDRRKEFQKEKAELAVALQRLEKYNIKMLQALQNSTGADSRTAVGKVSISKAKDIVKNLESLIYKVTSRDYQGIDGADPTYERIHNPIPSKSAIIPLRFNGKLDGISGMVIGNVFKIDKTRLPKGYQGDDIAFIITSEAQSITTGQDWWTDITGQLILLDLERERVDLDAEEVFTQEIELTIKEISQDNQAYLDELNVTPGVIKLFTQFVEEIQKEGLYELYITSGYRSFDEQVALYETRTNPDDPGEALYNNAKPGYSLHNYGLAIDVNVVNSTTGEFELKKATPKEEWENHPSQVVQLAERMGLAWGGDFADYGGSGDNVHFYTPIVRVYNPETDLYDSEGKYWWSQDHYKSPTQAALALLRACMVPKSKGAFPEGEESPWYANGVVTFTVPDHPGFEFAGQPKNMINENGQITDEYRSFMRKIKGNLLDMSGDASIFVRAGEYGSKSGLL
tara:strand:- start:1400 stop:5215 length:3816 start_codon:yes stop_codon:yes gene_type:complete